MSCVGNGEEQEETLMDLQYRRVITKGREEKNLEVMMHDNLSPDRHINQICLNIQNVV